MRIFGNAVMRNERYRYMGDFIMWHLEFLDGLFIYDDKSDDGSPMQASRYGAVAEIRDDDVPSFMEHEGRFRQAGYETFELAMQPLPGDWVLSLDLDEFFVTDGGAEREALVTAIDLIKDNFPNTNAIDVHFEEIFDYTDDRLYSRVDGFWGDINAPRLFRYELGGHIANRQMGCGSVPTFVKAEYRPINTRILHFGYADAVDRLAKHRRYTNHPNHGHNPSHIASILAVPTLVPWKGRVPWRDL